MSTIRELTVEDKEALKLLWQSLFGNKTMIQVKDMSEDDPEIRVYLHRFNTIKMELQGIEIKPKGTIVDENANASTVGEILEEMKDYEGKKDNSMLTVSNIKKPENELMVKVMKKFLNCNRIAAILGVRSQYVYNWCRSKTLPRKIVVLLDKLLTVSDSEIDTNVTQGFCLKMNDKLEIVWTQKKSDQSRLLHLENMYEWQSRSLEIMKGSVDNVTKEMSNLIKKVDAIVKALEMLDPETMEIIDSHLLRSRYDRTPVSNRPVEALVQATMGTMANK